MMWMKAMLAAFLLNGMSPFGLKVLAEMGLTKEYEPIYLFYWYLGGTAIVVLWILFKRQRLSWPAVAVGVLMGLCSIGGQVCMSRALAQGVPGNVVFPLAMGASICIVAAGGVLIFKERVGIYGKIGIITGLTGSVLLGLWG